MLDSPVTNVCGDGKIITATVISLENHKTTKHFMFYLLGGFLNAQLRFYFIFYLPVKQQFIAIADFYGTLHILEIPWTLSHPSTNEVSTCSFGDLSEQMLMEVGFKNVFRNDSF